MNYLLYSDPLYFLGCRSLSIRPRIAKYVAVILRRVGVCGTDNWTECLSGTDNWTARLCGTDI